MRTLNSIIGTACACLVLANCTYFDTGAAPAPSERIDVTVREHRAQHDLAFSQKSVQEKAPVFAAPITNPSYGSVDVYDFTRRAPRVQTSHATHPSAPVALTNSLSSPVSAPIYADDSVEIYPIDGGGQALAPKTQDSFAAPASLEVAPSLAPKAQYNSDKAAKIYFGHGIKSINEKGTFVLSKLSGAIADENHPIKVTGYASERADIEDPVARKIANLKTSMDRAFEVTSHLIRSGVPAETIETSAWGEVNPAAAIDDMDAENASRRVEVTSRRLP